MVYAAQSMTSNLQNGSCVDMQVGASVCAYQPPVSDGVKSVRHRSQPDHQICFIAMFATAQSKTTIGDALDTRITIMLHAFGFAVLRKPTDPH